MDFVEKFISLKRSHKIALVFVLLLAGRFIFQWLALAPKEQTRDIEPLKVEVIHSTAKMLQAEVPLSGRTVAHRRVEIRAETKGQILERIAKEGASIQGGTPMVSLSIDERAAELAEAQAVLEQRRLEFEAAQTLSEKSFRSPTNLARAKANLETAQAKLKRIETTLRDTKVKAPFSGTIEQYYVDKGDYVKAGDRVAIFVQTNPLKASFYASETQRLHLTLNQPCTITLSGKILKGSISQLRSLAQDKTKTFYGEITLSEIPETFPRVEGLTVRILALSPPQQIHTMSPAHLSLSSEGILGVKILDAQNKVYFSPVQIIKHTSEGIWVTGLPKKITLVTTGHEFAQEGQIVNAYSNSPKNTPSMKEKV